MTNPPVFCDGSCGAAEELPEFIDVYVPIVGAEWSDYNTGVRFKFDVDEFTRCVWIPEEPTVGDWDIEKLSRYPLGWAFPFIEPVADRWTWRLSIDRTHAPLFAGGWTSSFPRHVAGQNDSAKSCVHQQQLLNYVPLFTRPRVNIVPDDSLSLLILPKQTSTGCFCSEGCQPGLVPYDKYFIQSIGQENYPGLAAGKLLEFFRIINGVCSWLPVEPDGGANYLEMTKFGVTPEFGADGHFQFKVEATNISATTFYDIDCQWSTAATPFPGPSSNCNLPFWLPATTDQNLRILPCPNWMCDDDQARAWFASIEEVP